MGDNLMSQADIDAMLLSMNKSAGNTPDSERKSSAEARPAKLPPQRPAREAPPSQPAEPKRPPSQALHQTEEYHNSINLQEMNQRLTRLESMVKSKLDQIEKRLSATTQGTSPEQLRSLAKRAESVERELSSISVRLKGTPGYGAYQTFKCDKCASQGKIAIALTCTSCGHKNLRGWWPKK